MHTVILLLLAPVADAATLSVCATCTHKTIGSAISAAAGGDTITVAAGTYSENLTIGKTVTITGSGSGSTVITPTSSTGITVTASATVSGLALRGSSSGRGIQVSGSSTVLTLDDVAVSGFYTSNGAGLDVQFATVIGTDLLFDGNTAAGNDGGHVSLYYGSASFTDSTFVNGQASDQGGALYVDNSSLDLVGCTVSYNLSTSGGAGAVDQFGTSTVTIVDSWFEGNDGKDGGALACASSSSGTLAIDGSTFVDNTSGSRGGVIYCQNGGVLAVTDSTFEGNGASQSGGALYLEKPDRVELSRNLFCRNTSQDGAAVYARYLDYGGISSYLMANNRFVGNIATSNGGAIYVEQSYLAAINNSYVGNTAGNQGGAVYVRSPRSHESRNELFAHHVSGNGAVYAGCCGSVQLDYALFWSNTPDLGGTVSKGTGTISSTDPMFVAYSNDGDCTNDDLRPTSGSPVLDAGDPSLYDPDGTRSDIGAFGGPSADTTLFDDVDGDGLIGLFDCDDTDSGVGVPTWYADADGDGYGVTASSVESCVAPTGYAADFGDCDDTRASVAPGGSEVCNGLDDDCDGTTDGADASDAATWYADADKDGFGDATKPTKACTAPTGTVADSTDCDDADATETDGGLWYPDADGDGFGDPSVAPTKACTAPTSHVADSTDCDDTDPALTDGLDWYPDADDDGYGDSSGTSVRACAGPTGTIDDSTDCDDVDATVNPGATELCADGIDQDCDGVGLLTDDEDGDGLPTEVELADAIDPCGPDSDGDGVVDGDEYDGTTARDTDEDGVIDALDDDDDGDGVPTAVEGDGDIDGDGLANNVDSDADGDGRADVDEGTGDDDEDGIPNWADTNDSDGLTGDADGDGLTNGEEAGRDTDGDGIADALEPDDDGDGVPTRDEDTNGNGDWTDDDEDGDGLPDWLDPTSDGDTDVDTDVADTDVADTDVTDTDAPADTDDDPTVEPPEITEYGCGCATSAPGSALWPAALALAALLRRRSSRRSKGFAVRA